MLKIGHRGAKAYAPENTISSFQKALELGVDMIELDVRITKDKHPVVVHDNKLRRLTSNFVRVNKLTLAQLKKLKVKKTESIPTLAEVLDIVDSQAGLNIELKVRGSALLVVQVLRDYKVDLDNIMISSNHPGEIKMVEKLEPTITTALVFRSASGSFSLWLVLDFLALLLLPITKYYIAWLIRHAGADYLSINHRFLDRRKVRAFQKRGIKICAWTVNSKRKIQYLRELGIDGIITNYPDRF